MTFIVQQKLSLNEFIRSTLLYLPHNRAVRKLIIIVCSVVSLVVFLGQDWSFDKSILSAFLNTVDWIALIFIIIMAFIALTCSYIFKTQKHLFENVTYQFTDWGIARHGNRTEFSKPWKEVSKIVETKSFFLFCFGVSDYHIIQKRMFKDSSELIAFTQEIEGQTRT
jgi:YcxB-like protein